MDESWMMPACQPCGAECCVCEAESVRERVGYSHCMTCMGLDGTGRHAPDETMQKTPRRSLRVIPQMRSRGNWCGSPSSIPP